MTLEAAMEITGIINALIDIKTRYEVLHKQGDSLAADIALAAVRDLNERLTNVLLRS